MSYIETHLTINFIHQTLNIESIKTLKIETQSIFKITCRLLPTTLNIGIVRLKFPWYNCSGHKLIKR